MLSACKVTPSLVERKQSYLCFCFISKINVGPSPYN